MYTTKTKLRRSTAVGLIAGITFSTLGANAGLIEINAQGVLHGDPTSPLYVAALDAVPWTMKFRFNTATADSDASPTLGNYALSLSQVAVSVNGISVAPTGLNGVVTLANQPQGSNYVSGIAASADVDLSSLGVPGWLTATVKLSSEELTAVPVSGLSDALPDSPAALAARYGSPVFTLTNATGGPYIPGTVLEAQISEVPEPGALALLSTSLLGLLWRRRATATQPNSAEPNSQPAAGTGTGSNS